jgi:hypothetical protein
LSRDRVTIGGFWIDDWIYWTRIQLVPTINYDAIANSHTLLLTVARAKSAVSSLGVAWQRILSFHAQQLPFSLSGFCLTTENCSQGPSYITSVLTEQRTPFQIFPLLLRACPLPSDCFVIVGCLYSRCLAMAVSLAPFLRL